jgi:hypothetical protein
MDTKPVKKTGTDDSSINKAEEKLDIKYPEIIKGKLKESNGFRWGYFDKFYPVFDEEDKFHTFDDVVRENENPNGWKTILPEGYVAIASDDAGNCMTLSTKKDGIVYFFDHETGEIDIFASNETELKEKLDKEEKELEEIYHED